MYVNKKAPAYAAYAGVKSMLLSIEGSSVGLAFPSLCIRPF